MKITRRRFVGQCAMGATAIGFTGIGCTNSPKTENITDLEIGSTPPNQRDLFDGKSLTGWHATPRIYVPNEPQFADIPAEELKAAVVRHHELSENPVNVAKVKDLGNWRVEEGAIVGGQSPDSQYGAYLLSDEKFGDFELTLEARPDWPADTGIMIRAHELGSIGFQVLVDHRPGGAIGGFFGNSIGNFRAYPFNVDGDEQEGYQVANLRAFQTDVEYFKPDFAAPATDFLAAWKSNEWNTFRIRCVGRLPKIETWINGTPIAKLDFADLSDRVPGYDPEKIFKRLGSAGHIGFEVHDNDSMGRNRWAPGAVCRWRNIQITEL